MCSSSANFGCKIKCIFNNFVVDVFLHQKINNCLCKYSVIRNFNLAIILLSSNWLTLPKMCNSNIETLDFIMEGLVRFTELKPFLAAMVLV